VGSAQRCEHGALLQHGSILLSGSQTRVLDLMTRPDSGVRRRRVDHARGADRRPWVRGRADDALRTGFERIFGTRLAPGRLDQRENDRAEQLAGRYGADEWTWRR
jgi:lipoate-protein ligase A